MVPHVVAALTTSETLSRLSVPDACEIPCRETGQSHGASGVLDGFTLAFENWPLNVAFAAS